MKYSTKNWLACLIMLLTVFISCSVNKANIDNSLKKYFDENKVEGCFTMYNNKDGKVTVYNMQLDTVRVTPASTFKIVNSLIAIETGVISDEKMVIKWDGVKRWNEEWNKDLDFTQAFKASAVPYFQAIAKRIGKDTMQRWIDSLNYGNRIIGKNIDSFWLDNSIKISADEQVGLIKRLYFDQLPFQKRTQQMVRSVMLQEENTQYTLSYKTGFGFDENNKSIGWVTGWIEENKHPFFFTLMIQTADKTVDIKTVRIKILKNILTQYGFFKGTM